MSIREQLETDAKTALKAQDRVRLEVIRLVRSQIKYVEIDKGHALSDEETIEVLVSALKSRRESLDFSNKGGREDLVEKARQEIHIIESYLPRQFSETEVREIISEAIRETGAGGPKDMGRVMGAIMPRLKGRADGKLVNTLVKEALSG
ncbi:MAG: GatB/YqeY domain-containing protein [candidate division Zixibacteria bacterium]|nr:GatB/YqeY domain-containing protein [candidate division Zixibacteria bacterium]